VKRIYEPDDPKERQKLSRKEYLRKIRFYQIRFNVEKKEDLINIELLENLYKKGFTMKTILIAGIEALAKKEDVDN